MLSILVWWAIPAVAVTLAAVVAAVSRRIRRAREDIGTLQRYQRAREVLERTQRPVTRAPALQPNLSAPTPTLMPTPPPAFPPPHPSPSTSASR